MFDPSSDSGSTFLTFRSNVAGTASNSNMFLIDAALHTHDGQIAALQAVKGIIYVPLIYQSANYFTATGISAISSYTDGMIIDASLNQDCTGTVTININNLGTKTLLKYNATGSGTINLTAGDMKANKDYLFRYSTSAGAFIWVSPTSGDQINSTWATQTISSGPTTLVAGSAPIVLADTTSAAFTIKLPATPGTGEWFTLLDLSGTFTTHNLTVDPNGKNIEGSGSTIVFSIPYSSNTYFYNGTAWVIKEKNFKNVFRSGVLVGIMAAPSSPPTGVAQIYYDSGAPGVGTTSKPVIIDESGNKLVLGGLAIKDYRIIKITNIFQGTTSYTPSNGSQALYVECVGGGGGGGGSATSSSNLSLGGGGGAGAYSAAWITGTLKSSYTVQVGAGGGGNSGTTGSTGTDSTFDSPSIVTAKGGTGGLTLATGSSIATISGGSGGASLSGVGDITCDGSEGGWGLRNSAGGGRSGNGGIAPIGSGLAGGSNASGAGSVGCKYGGGGSGGLTTSSANAGGAGANGLIRVWEYA
jgi:hypothetical protein